LGKDDLWTGNLNTGLQRERETKLEQGARGQAWSDIESPMFRDRHDNTNEEWEVEEDEEFRELGVPLSQSWNCAVLAQSG